jgi:MoaA/NifB/PqqE/SkfB family radical SAM enzyme
LKKTVSFSKNSANVFFHILTACNLKCRHCYINPEQHGKEMLPLPTIESWLKVFAQKNRPANLILLGGEPTLHPELDRVVEKARNLNYASVTIDTNGYLFNNILNKIGPNDVDYLSFSLDGATKETNDLIRGRGSFENCMAGIKAAVKKKFNASLIFTVSKENIHELKEMENLVLRLGINRFFIQVIGIRGRLACSEDSKTKFSALQVSKEEWLETVPDLAEKIAGKGVTVTYPKVFLAPEETFECAGIVADNWFIFPNGRVYKCPLCEDYPIHSMRIEEDRLIPTKRINEKDLFNLQIPEGCVMNRLIQPDNLKYHDDGTPMYRIACCLLKEEICY